MHKLEEEALATLHKGSKTFALAASFFPEDLRCGAALIYAWCRHVDDVIDDGDGSLETLNLLETKTASVWMGQTSMGERPFEALRVAVDRYNIPMAYPLDLLQGMRMDIQHHAYLTLQDLELYCYRVASTVGLMMCHVMGLFHISALKQAAELGMGMQMTNICRDVKADHLIGRCYLPLSLLQEAGLDLSSYMDPKHRPQLFSVIKRLIKISEHYYESGLKGVQFLPWRSALTIIIAGKIYREIGREIIRRGPPAIEQRTVVPFWRKLLLISSSIFELLLQIPERVRSNHRPILIRETWRLT